MPPPTFTLGDQTDIVRQLIEDYAGTSDTFIADGDTLYQYRQEPLGLWQPVEDAIIACTIMGYSGGPCTAKLRARNTPKPLEVNASTVSGATALLKQRLARPSFFADAPPGVPFENGFLTFEGEGHHTQANLVQLQAHHRQRSAFDFPYQLEAEYQRPEKFLKFLRHMVSDKSVEEQTQYEFFVQEYFGLCLIGRATKFERIVFAVGRGGTGNSTLASVMADCMPQGSVCAVQPSQMDNEFHRIHLRGARVNWIDDLPHDKPLASGFTKSIASGQPITGCLKFKDVQSFRPTCGQWFCCNKLPTCLDTSDGWRRRPVILKFDVQIPDDDRDRGLRDDIIREERTAIVTWLIEGAVRALRSNVLNIPKGNDERVSRWISKFDNMSAYVAENLVKLPEVSVDRATWMKLQDLYDDYKRWAETSGLQNKRNKQTFGEELSEHVTKVHAADGEWYAVQLHSAAANKAAEEVLKAL